MLVLTRKVDEDIVITGTELMIRVLGIKGNRVRIGIEAPQEVRVVRGEVAVHDGTRNLLRGGAGAAREAHYLEVGGASPPPAT